VSNRPESPLVNTTQNKPLHISKWAARDGNRSVPEIRQEGRIEVSAPKRRQALPARGPPSSTEELPMPMPISEMKEAAN